MSSGSAVDFGVGQARLDDLVGDEPAEQDDEQRGCCGETPVAQRVNFARGVEDLRALLGETLQQRIEPRRDRVCRETTGDPSEGRGDASEGMATRGREDDAAEGMTST